MKDNEWKIGEARQQFSDVLRRSESEPQFIYRRNRLIAAVVAVDPTKSPPVIQRVTIGDRFAEARELFRAERYRLPEIRRRSRRTAPSSS